MATYVDMSLEDIIRKKKKVNKSGQTKLINKPSKPMTVLPKQKLPVFDARLKIISNKRKHITDARDKLAEIAKQKDARQKLEQLRMKRMFIEESKHVYHYNRKLTRTISNKERVFVDPSRQVVSQPLNVRAKGRRQIKSKKFLEDKIIRNRSYERYTPLKPILRTVSNDIEIIDDPMGEEYEPSLSNRTPVPRKPNLQLKIVAHNNESQASRSGYQRTATVEKEKSPSRPPSILKKRPMAALRNEKKSEPTVEYRIIVSNLRNTVTSGDIEELFGDVGEMLESRLVRPGTAEVIYKSQDDAQRAVDLYHNRQLDGQPMNCLLVTPRSNASSSRNTSRPALYSTNSNVEPDISTFHKVLFSNF